MKKHIQIAFLLILSFTILSFNKIKSTEIDLNNFDSDLLEILILEKVNKLRENKRLVLLEKDYILKKAAKDQCNYLNKKKKLTHRQVKYNKKSPLKRVKFYNGKFSNVGENIAYTYLFSSVKGAKKKNKTVRLTTYEATAEYFFQLWKNSKGHYDNLISKSYNYSGIDFTINKKNNRIYSAQVFGYK